MYFKSHDQFWKINKYNYEYFTETYLNTYVHANELWINITCAWYLLTRIFWKNRIIIKKINQVGKYKEKM